ncbi:MAG: hypothetical protein ACE5E9_04105 [Nitrospinaceae bacterium]
MENDEKNQEGISPKEENGDQEKPAGQKPDAALEARISKMTQLMETFSSELETIKLNIQKRKSENTTLKILFYTGLIVLLLGFLYTNSTLQRAQLQSLESNIDTLQNRMNRELVIVEKNLYREIQRIEDRIQDLSGNDLIGVLQRMNDSLSRWNPGNEKTAGLIQEVLKNSRELLAVYGEQKNSQTEKPETGKSAGKGEAKNTGSDDRELKE